MDKQLTSEEKLLRVIRKKGTDEAKASGSKKTKEKGRSLGERLSLTFVNRFLGIIIIVGLALLGVKYFGKPNAENPDKLPHEKNLKEDTVKTDSIIADVKPYEFYWAEISKKDLFRLPWEQNTDNMNVTQPAGSEFLKSLQLTGIVLDKDPKAVIEDTAAGQTYFLSVGDAISGAKVRSIGADRVMLDYNGTVQELKP